MQTSADSNKPQHTPGPWRIDGNGTIRTQDHWIAEVHWRNQDANAAFIVKACNQHAFLTKALREALGCLDDPTGGQHVADMRRAAEIIRAALALAEPSSK